MEKGTPLAKIIVIGDSAVGKSCLIQKMTTNEFKEDFDATVGVEFGTLTFKFDEAQLLKL